jgi:sugar phosphate isomerase/epimerase
MNLAPGASITERAMFVADAGFDGIELVVTPGDLEAIMPEVRAFSESGQVQVSGIVALHRGWLIDPDPVARRGARSDVAALLDFAGEIGNCGVIVIPILGCTNAYPGARTTGRTQEDDRALLCEVLTDLAHYADRAGAELWLELINRYESPVGNTLVEGMAIMEAVKNPAFRLHADFFHMNIEEDDLPSALAQTGESLAYVHCADSKRTYPGFGHLDYPALVRALAQVGYQGYLTVDSGDPTFAPNQVLPHVAQYLRGVIGLATSRDR